MKHNRLIKTWIIRCFSPVFLILSLCVSSCTQQKFTGDFYLGLAEKSDIKKIQESVKLFEKSLKSSNLFIRQAAAEELAALMSKGAAISAKTEKRVRKEISGTWADAFEAVDSLDKNKALELLLSFDQNTPIEIRHYLLDEFTKHKMFFNDMEFAVIDGHFAVLNFNYNEALVFFSSFQEDGNWTDEMPLIFLEYPELIIDLGRAFQYTSSGLEGLSIFLQWENNLTDNTVIKTPETVRYRLLFYAARIARRNGRNDQAVSLFEQALNLAPDTEQSQACIWYILDLSLSEIFIQRLEKFVPYWDNGDYFNDILDNFLQILVSKKDWKNIIGVFRIIKDSGASVKAAYSWVIARAVEEGFISSDEVSLAAGTADASAFFQIAYNAAANDTSSYFYYRILSADALGKPLFDISEQTEKTEKPSPVVQFILDFFTFNVPEYVMRYIYQLENELSTGELRMIADALENEGMYIQSIQLVSRYIDREGYIPVYRDMELMFPRPYMELVDKYAAETEIAPQLLYSLIRTESAFQSGVISSAGAVGLTQLMPATALEMAGRIRRAGGPDYADEENNLDLTDPALNIHIGAFYLKYLSDRFEDDLLSVLSYNGGMNRIRRWRAASSFPNDLFLETVSIYETRNYGRKVMAAADVYDRLYYKQR